MGYNEVVFRNHESNPVSVFGKTRYMLYCTIIKEANMDPMSCSMGDKLYKNLERNSQRLLGSLRLLLDLNGILILYGL